jgi:lipoprotein-anchoring transpeptidase ErfK/SrfK
MENPMKAKLYTLISILLLGALALTACGTGSGVKTIEADLGEPEPLVTTTTKPEVQAETATLQATATPTPEQSDEVSTPDQIDQDESGKATSVPDPVPDALITVAAGPLTVLESPAGAVLAELDATTPFGSPTTLAVLELGDEWVKVGGLPIRPNGSVGYIARDAADLRRVTFRIEVDLEDRMLSVFSGDDLYLQSAVAVGAPGNPTPAGHLFIVTDVLDTGDPNSPYGRFALGLSGLSDQLTEFAGGPGQIGIHGTNDPSSIGQAVSHGCVRVPAEIAERLAGVLPLGTPVIIT